MFAVREAYPTAVLLLAVVLASKLNPPTDTLFTPVVVLNCEFNPIATLYISVFELGS